MNGILHRRLPAILWPFEVIRKLALALKTLLA